MREPIKLACEALRGGRALNMGQCVKLFELAADANEARAITDAYAGYLVEVKGLSADEAGELARRNILTGTSYMSADAANALYSAVFAKERANG